MSEFIRISDVRFTRAPSWWQEKGLLGWASCVVDDALGVGGLAVRRTQDGRLTLSFPGRKDASGQIHHHVRPRDDQTRRAIEAQVIGELQAQGVLA